VEPLVFTLLVAWALVRYGVTDLVATIRGTESLRHRERMRRLEQQHEREMTRLREGHAGPTVGEAIGQAIASRIAGDGRRRREPREPGPAAQFFSEWWSDAWSDATERRRRNQERARAGELWRQRMVRAVAEAVQQ
jgi:hypothetical protein